LKKIFSCQGLSDKELEVTRPSPRRLRIIIYDVPDCLDKENLEKAILKQNSEILQDVNLDTWGAL